jgi:hypothetical protein
MDNEIQYIVDAIKEGKCIFVLGPEFARNSEGTPLDKWFAQLVAAKKNSDIQYYANEDFYFFNKPRARVQTIADMLKSYESVAPHAIYSKLAEIPFHAVINLSPDLILPRMFEKSGINAQFRIYHIKKAHESFATPIVDSPLIYNLMGAVDKNESLLLTHDDMFNYLQSILGDFDLPNDLSNVLQSATYFILMGFRFEKWQMQMILRLLTFKKDNPFVKMSTSDTSNSEIITMYNNQFQIEFVPEKFDDFIEMLHSQFAPAELRKMKRDELSLIDAIRTLIKADKISEAIEKLENYAKEMDDKEMMNYITVASGSYSSTKLKMLEKRITQEEAEITMNKTKYTLLEYLNEM